MDRFKISIQKSLENQNWFSALFLSLTIPDICGAIENPPTGKRGEVSQRYCDWFNRFLKKKYNPENLYELVSVRSPGVLDSMDETGIESLKKTPPNGSCAFSAEDC